MTVQEVSTKYGINFQALADGIYDMMPENDKAVVKFGMTPKPWLDMFMKNLKEIYVRKYYSKTPPHLITKSFLKHAANHIKKEIISEWEHAFCLALMKNCKF